MQPPTCKLGMLNLPQLKSRDSCFIDRCYCWSCADRRRNFRQFLPYDYLAVFLALNVPDLLFCILLPVAMMRRVPNMAAP